MYTRINAKDFGKIDIELKIIHLDDLMNSIPLKLNQNKDLKTRSALSINKYID